MILAYDWLGPLMFVAALILLSFGYPVAFSLAQLRQLVFSILALT